MLHTLLNNRYQIIKELGYGGFGTTYLAQDSQDNNSWCAIKKLNPLHADIETAKKLFKREADTLLKLQQVPQVPEFIEYFAEDNCDYLVEEYIEGSSLEELLTHQWSMENILIFLWDILSILQLLHRQNIVHRDIKPSNLIQRNKDNKFTIIDFGAVKEINGEQQEKGTCIYHQGYAPIEQMQGMPQLNSDIYALGMTAIQLLTREPPRELIRDESDRAIAPDSRIAPSWLIDILNKMVRTDFKERYQSVEEVLKDLSQRDNPSGFNHDLPNNSPSLEPTKPISPNLETTVKIATPQSKVRQKLIYLPLILLPLLVLVSEITHPWLRPWYYLREGNSLLDRNQPQASLNKFQQVIDLQRDSATAWKARGDALFTLGRHSGALGAYDKALELEPDNPKALNNKGKILYQQGELTQAIAAHQKAIKSDSNNADAWSSLGLAQMSLGQYQEALKSFDRAQEIAPDNPTFWIQKGIVLKALQLPQEANNFYQEALAVYDEVTNKNNKNPALWSDRGFVLLQLNRPQDAFASYDRALMLNENFYEALIGKANAYNLVKDYQQALVWFDRALEIRPQDYQVWYNRGNLQLQGLNNPTEALKSFQKATTINPDFYPAWLGQGFSFNALEKYPDAKSALNTAMKFNSRDPYAWFNLGLALEALGELQSAYDAYHKAVELNFSPAQEYLSQMELRLGL